MPDLTPEPQLPTSDVDPLAAECALSVIGLEHILACDPTWNLLQKKLAAQIPKVIKKYLLEFVSKEDRREVEDMPAFDYTATRKLLDQGTTVKQATALSEAINNPRLGLAVAANATRLVHLLQAQLPRSSRQTATGTIVGEPSPNDTADFARSWQVACKPMVVLIDLVEGSLVQEQVAAMEDYWPNLFELIETVANEVIAKMKVKRGDGWELDDKRDRLLGLIMGQTDGGPDLSLAADYQAMYAQKTSQPTQPAANPNIKFKSDLGTPGQTGNAS